MYIFHALIDTRNAHMHMMHINLNTMFYTHVEHNPTKTIYIKYYIERKKGLAYMYALCVLSLIHISEPTRLA